ncbi:MULTISPECIES: fructose-6-phosphate aldolase [unclassified Fusobacterium]|uniref:fructose-6-phosphate aldolase n=1 Tax=unclassified Fusobacterium TaxID=2648384 RepID=UPI002604A89F|nr:fructose-6-phosphate aldolase [Fusobacterium sp.]
MKIFIDTANLEEIREAESYGIIAGVTTNPSLIARENGDFEKIISEITKIVEGPISAEVLSLEADKMVEEGKKLASIHKNIVIKLPTTFEGLKACKRLKELGIKTNLTLIFTLNQALLAARAGATYVSPFVGRLEDTGVDGIELVKSIRETFDKHGIESEIIGASIRNIYQVEELAKVGAHIGTLPFKVIQGMIKHQLTDAGIERFLNDWKNVKNS